jgi:hypothetical protein
MQDNKMAQLKVENSAQTILGYLPLAIAFPGFLFPCTSSSNWTQTLDLGMTRRVFFHCADTAGPASHRITYLQESTLKYNLILKNPIKMMVRHS